MSALPVAGADPQHRVIGPFAGDGPVGPVPAASFGQEPAAIAARGSLLYVADSHWSVVRAVDTATGMSRLVAGTGYAGSGGEGGRATAAPLNRPSGVTLDADGSLFVSDTGNHRVRRIGAGADGVVRGDPDEVVTTVAGTGARGGGGDGGPATAASLADPTAVAVDGSGNLFIADTGNDRVRRVAGPGVDASGGPGTISTLAGLSNRPTGLALDRTGNLFVAESGRSPSISYGEVRRVRRVDAATGGVTTVLGRDDPVGYGDPGLHGNGDGGPAKDVTLIYPSSLAFDGHGNLFISESKIGIRRDVRSVEPGADGLVTGAPDEIIRTVAGSGDVVHTDGTKVRSTDQKARETTEARPTASRSLPTGARPVSWPSRSTAPATSTSPTSPTAGSEPWCRVGTAWSPARSTRSSPLRPATGPCASAETAGRRAPPSWTLPQPWWPMRAETSSWPTTETCASEGSTRADGSRRWPAGGPGAWPLTVPATWWPPTPAVRASTGSTRPPASGPHWREAPALGSRGTAVRPRRRCSRRRRAPWSTGRATSWSPTQATPGYGGSPPSPRSSLPWRSCPQAPKDWRSTSPATCSCRFPTVTRSYGSAPAATAS